MLFLSKKPPGCIIKAVLDGDNKWEMALSTHCYFYHYVSFMLWE